jgi:hypothetical protein
MEVKGKILAKKSDNKAFKLSDENWYNVNADVISSLEKLSKGDEVVVTYEKKNTSRNVSNLINAKSAPSAKETPKSSTGFACSECGAELKDGKYKKCYKCNQKSPKDTTPAPEQESNSEFKCEDCGASLKDGKYKKCYKCGKKKGGFGKSYDSPEKTAQIQRGNALNAAAAVASGQKFDDPDAATQYTLILANSFLEWLRTE